MAYGIRVAGFGESGFEEGDDSGSVSAGPGGRVPPVSSLSLMGWPVEDKTRDDEVAALSSMGWPVEGKTRDDEDAGLRAALTGPAVAVVVAVVVVVAALGVCESVELRTDRSIFLTGPAVAVAVAVGVVVVVAMSETFELLEL